MLSVPGHHVGDAWYFVDGERVHCFFLICPDEVPRHVAWDIAHASSDNLRDWVFHGVVLRRGEPAAWDGQCLATGSVVRHGGRYWMAYTGNWFGPQPAVGLAYSSDLYAWQKLAHNPVTRIDERQYTAHSRGRRQIPHWRDPFLRVIGDWVYQFVCATAADPSVAYGTVGVARSADMHGWELRPPLAVDPFTEELECPQIVSLGTRHYLFFSSQSDWLAGDVRSATTGEGGNMYAMVGDSVLGRFRMLDPRPVLPVNFPEPTYAGQIVRFHDAPYLLGTIWRDDGDRISDPIALEFTATGIRALV
jgi:beta-fructofuranosidase